MGIDSSFFISKRDRAFIDSINQELIDDIIETPVIIYSLDLQSTKENIYGESAEKVYRVGLEFNALIANDDQETDDSDFGSNILQRIVCGFHRESLREKDFYPERGDIIKWNDAYFEITSVIDNQFIAGKVGMPHSIMCTAVMVNRSSINVRVE